MPFPDKKLVKEWEYKQIASLSKGINLSIRPDQLEDEELLTCNNITIQKDRLQRDSGYVTFADAVEGVMQVTYQFQKTSGSVELVGVSTYSFYVYVPAVDQWQFASSGVDTTTTATASAGATSITVADITGFTDGSPLGIILDDGTQHRTTINGAPAGSTINFDDAIPVGRSVENGAVVVQGVDLSGDTDNQVIARVLPSHDWFVFTNGVDIVKRYDGTDCTDVPGLPSSGNVICKAVELYNNSLFLINTIEGGTAHPRRVRRSNSADPTDWTTGTAGYDDLYDSEDQLMGSEILGPYMIVYAERSIIRGEYIGTGGINYQYNTMIRGEGVFASQGIADVGDMHVIFAQSNLYLYRGGFDLEPIGDNIYYKIFGSQGDLDPTNKHRTFCFYVEELDEVWMFYPSTSALTGCDQLVKLNLAEKSFATRVFAKEFIGFGFYQRGNSRTWNSLIGSWLDQTWKWNDKSVTANSPTTHLCCSSPAIEVMEYDYVATLDDDIGISYTVETKDYTSPDAVQRFDMLEIGVRGTNVLVEYSTDEGGSWTELGVITRSSFGRARLFAQFTFNKIRFKFTGSTQDFQLGWLGFSYKEESLYDYA